MKTITLLSLLLSIVCLGQDAKKTESTIENVTVFLEGATIERTASINLAKGISTFNINNLSPDVIESSIQFSGLKDVSVLSSTFEINYLEKKKQSIEYEKF